MMRSAEYSLGLFFLSEHPENKQIKQRNKPGIWIEGCILLIVSGLDFSNPNVQINRRYPIFRLNRI
jgi:hypothetical protein